MRILIVDDNRDAADTLALLLEFMGHECCVAYDGASALICAAEAPFHLVFCDLYMPGFSGLELCPRLRALDTLAESYLVAWTGWTAPHAHERALQVGFDCVVLKPTGGETLVELLDSLEPQPPQDGPEPPESPDRGADPGI